MRTDASHVWDEARHICRCVGPGKSLQLHIAETGAGDTPPQNIRLGILLTRGLTLITLVTCLTRKKELQ